MKVSTIIAYVLVGVLLCLNLYQCRHARIEPAGATYTDTLTVYDTISYYNVVPRDSVVVRYITERLPKVEPNEQAEAVALPCDRVPDARDSVLVEMPISQKVYETDRFKAFVSGCRPNLDSITIYAPTQIIRIKDKPKRWGVGIQAGCGFTPHGATPYIGIGVSYNIITF